jgi:hypothetical protein
MVSFVRLPGLPCPSPPVVHHESEAWVRAAKSYRFRQKQNGTAIVSQRRQLVGEVILG